MEVRESKKAKDSCEIQKDRETKGKNLDRRALRPHTSSGKMFTRPLGDILHPPPLLGVRPPVAVTGGDVTRFPHLNFCFAGNVSKKKKESRWDDELKTS